MNTKQENKPGRLRASLKTGLFLSALIAVFVLLLRPDLSMLHWVSELTAQGSPAPKTEVSSPTGYTGGQRHFLGYRDRGETYRWISEAQQTVATGLVSARTYTEDNTPSGRPDLQPRLYALWLIGIGHAIQGIAGIPLPLALEEAALWEPVVTHVLGFILLSIFLWRRFGPLVATATGLFFVLSPALLCQFLPGVLGTRTLAGLLAAFTLLLHIPSERNQNNSQEGFGILATILTAAALWLSPAFGVPLILITGAIAVCDLFSKESPPPVLRWAVLGFLLTMAACLVDQTPWSPTAGELKYLHPLYAFAWLGIGLGLHGWARLSRESGTKTLAWLYLTAAAPLVGALVYWQTAQRYPGWLRSGASMLRLTSIDESLGYRNGFEWLGSAAPAEITFLLAPAMLAAAALALLSITKDQGGNRRHPVRLLILFITLCLLCLAQIRWLGAASLLFVCLFWSIKGRIQSALRPLFPFGFAILLLGLALWSQNLPAHLRRPTTEASTTPTDMEELVYRHCAHWLSSHSGDNKVSALAPPELSDSLVFHGGCRVLMSTAWESFAGQVAASRVLSAPDASEVEAVLQSREVTHLILPSWDKVLPLLVREPETGRVDTLYDKLQRWVAPSFLRPIPYHLPPMDGFLDKKLVVYQVTPAEDEATALSRLAEYFAEMNRSEPAELVAKVLAESYPNDPNALIARATVHAHDKDAVMLERELSQLEASVSNTNILLAWDRRIQRAIVLSLGRRHRTARGEINTCLANATQEAIRQLTPLAAHRLLTLARAYRLQLPDPVLARLLDEQGAEYRQTSQNEAR